MANRKPHAVMDLPSRLQKAKKIERLLGIIPGRVYRILEVGTGAGGIAAYFGNHPTLECEVTSVDVTDSRNVFEGYRFQLVTDTRLPFADAEFDVVISNHVIEHVGEGEAQLHHLRELRRVMELKGVGYLAQPNRWMLVEPHYKLPLLSWLPRTWRSPYLRFMRGSGIYDCEPLSRSQLEGLLAEAGWRFENICAQAAHVMNELEPGNGFLEFYSRCVPSQVKRMTLSIMPTLIYRLSRGVA